MTCDMDSKNYSDIEHSLLLDWTCDILENKRQGHGTLSFQLTCDIGGPLSRAPVSNVHRDISMMLKFNGDVKQT